jgi:hypothetical protein
MGPGDGHLATARFLVQDDELPPIGVVNWNSDENSDGTEAI